MPYPFEKPATGDGGYMKQCSSSEGRSSVAVACSRGKRELYYILTLSAATLLHLSLYAYALTRA